VKIIRTSAYDHEDQRGNQYFVAGGASLTQSEAEKLAQTLNSDPKRGEDDYYVVVEDNYKLWRFEP